MIVDPKILSQCARVDKGSAGLADVRPKPTLAQNPKSNPNPRPLSVVPRRGGGGDARPRLRRHLCRVCTAFAPRYTASAPRQVLFAAAWITGEFAEFIGNYNEVRSAAPPRHRRLHDRSIDR